MSGNIVDFIKRDPMVVTDIEFGEDTVIKHIKTSLEKDVTIFYGDVGTGKSRLLFWILLLSATDTLNEVDPCKTAQMLEEQKVFFARCCLENDSFKVTFTYDIKSEVMEEIFKESHSFKNNSFFTEASTISNMKQNRPHCLFISPTNLYELVADMVNKDFVIPHLNKCLDMVSGMYNSVFHGSGYTSRFSYQDGKSDIIYSRHYTDSSLKEDVSEIEAFKYLSRKELFVHLLLFAVVLYPLFSDSFSKHNTLVFIDDMDTTIGDELSHRVLDALVLSYPNNQYVITAFSKGFVDKRNPREIRDIAALNIIEK